MLRQVRRCGAWCSQSLGRQVALLLALSILGGACATFYGIDSGTRAKGIKPLHAVHYEMGMEDCSDCHDLDAEPPARPDHDICGACHDIDIDNATPEDCGLCHVNEDMSMPERAKALKDELKFSHKAHAEAEVACKACHAEPDKTLLPTKDLKPFCMGCHEKQDAKLTECGVCHSVMGKDVRPQFRGEVRIPHDAPQIWENVHGQESRANPKFCTLCHDTETFCQDCHRKNPPKSHNVTWRRKSHGMRATWDAGKCAACHEEDFCIKCHKNTEPASHRGGWDAPSNRHCTGCHFPERQNTCLVCHESVEHRSAMRSPHEAGRFPVDCGRCHPGGRTFKAPHPLNSTAPCTACHK